MFKWRAILAVLLSASGVLSWDLEQVAYAGNLSGLTGGLKCADYLNNGVEWCFFVIDVGEIDSKSVDNVRTLLEHRRQSNRQIVASVVYLNSPGGSISDAITIGRIVRAEGLGAVVERGARCVSSCVLIFSSSKTSPH